MPKALHIPSFSFFKFILNRELTELYASIALRFFALSMISIFLPIYLLKELNLSIYTVMYFFIVFSIFFALSAFIGAKIAARIGFKHIILLSVPFLIAHFLLLTLLPVVKIPLFLIAILGAFAAGLYWIGHHTDLTRFTKRRARGEEVGLAFFVMSLAALLGPFVGGMILTFYNFTILFIAVSLLLLVSTIPLFFSKEFYERTSFSSKEVFKVGSFKDALAFTGQGIEIGAAGILWPIFIFLILNEYFSLGLIGTLSGIIVAFSSVIVGKLSDKKGKHFFIRIGAAALASLWFFRTLVKTVSHVYFVSIFSFIGSIVSVPTDTKAYGKARKSKHVVEYLVFREVFINLGRVIILLFMLLFANYIAAFIFTGIAQALLFLF